MIVFLRWRAIQTLQNVNPNLDAAHFWYEELSISFCRTILHI